MKIISTLVFSAGVLATIPLIEASDPPRTLKPETSRMISVLKGKPVVKPQSAPTPKIEAKRKVSAAATATASKPKVSAPIAPPAPSAPVAVRRARISPEAVPKGYAMTKSASSGSSVSAMKMGAAPATSAASGYTSAPMIAGHAHADDQDVITRGRPSNPQISEGGFPADLPGYPGGHSAAKPRPQEKPVPAEISYKVDSSSQLSTDTVKFIKGSVELADQASYEYLFSLADALRSDDLKGERFVVEGHASAEGSDFSNQVLSQRRANAIFDFLASRGVESNRLLAVGHGESQARFADSDPEFLRAQDRQVVVFKLAE